MPEKVHNILKLNNFHEQLPKPFVIYADFEAITEKIQGCKPNNDKLYREAYWKKQTVGRDIKLYVVRSW